MCSDDAQSPPSGKIAFEGPVRLGAGCVEAFRFGPPAKTVKAARKRGLGARKAPVGGVTPAEQLMTIVLKDAPLEIEASLANRDVGFVHKGEDAATKVEAFTFPRYGLLQGAVIGVSQDAVGAAEPDGPRSHKDEADQSANEQDRQARQPAYVAHVALKATGVQTEQGLMPLEAGMAVTAEIKTGRRRG